jgi:hypothetical protein
MIFFIDEALIGFARMDIHLNDCLRHDNQYQRDPYLSDNCFSGF